MKRDGVREALGGLTGRGRAFLAAGITAAVCAIVLGQPALVRVGVLVAVLPLACAVAVARRRHPVTPSRTIDPPVVTAGQTAQVRLELERTGRGALGPLLVEDRLPWALGSRPRFVVRGAAHAQSLAYPVRSDVRGRFGIGPLAVRVTDPFGMVEVTRTLPGTADVVVVPRTSPLPPISLDGAWTGAGDNRPRAFSSGSAEDVTVRDYRTGDDLRRVHWRSSARTGKLMVRREEQPWHSRATVLLDNRAGAHVGQGPASSLEAAVSHAASICRHLGERGYAVRLVTADGELRAGAWHERAAGPTTQALLEELAVVGTVDEARLVTDWAGEAGFGGLLVAVLGTVGDADRAALRRLRHQSGTACALALDTAAWSGRPAAAAGGLGGTALLTALGWRSVPASPRDRTPALWQALGTRHRGVLR